MVHRVITDALGLGLALTVIIACLLWAHFIGGDADRMTIGVVAFIACRAYVQGYRRDTPR